MMVVNAGEHRSNLASRSRGRQLLLPLPNRRGGARKGAGRKPGRPKTPHNRRPEHSYRQPVHVTLRSEFRQLRQQFVFPSVRLALVHAAHHNPERFRIIHWSVQYDHVHLIVEASDKTALSRGLQGLAVRVARYVNDAARGAKRAGAATARSASTKRRDVRTERGRQRRLNFAGRGLGNLALASPNRSRQARHAATEARTPRRDRARRRAVATPDFSGRLQVRCASSAKYNSLATPSFSGRPAKCSALTPAEVERARHAGWAARDPGRGAGGRYITSTLFDNSRTKETRGRFSWPKPRTGRTTMRGIVPSSAIAESSSSSNWTP